MIINRKETHETSIPQVTEAEQNYRNEINDYIIDRLKVITIDEKPKMQRSYAAVVAENQGQDIDTNQDESTVKSKNTKNDESSLEMTNEEMEEDTKNTNDSSQMKIIRELQKSVAALEQNQNRLLMHIESLENTVIALSDSEDDTVGYKKAKKIATKIKRKRQENRTYYTDESDTSEESQKNKRAPRFRKQQRGNVNKYSSAGTNQQNRSSRVNDIDRAEKETQRNESTNM